MRWASRVAWSCVGTAAARRRCTACPSPRPEEVAQEKQGGGPGSCGDFVADLDGCVDYACWTCDTTGGASSDSAKCEQSSLQAECKSFSDKVDVAPECAALQPDAATAKVLGCFL